MREQNALALLADVPGRARFAVNSWEDYEALPIRVRDAMIHQIEQWRAQENAQRNR